MLSIGVRELRQNASRYLRLAEAGQTIQVTDRGRPVARLVPAPRGGPCERLAASGRLRVGGGDLEGLTAPRPVVEHGRPPLSRVLETLRADER
ncbi:MAG: type II toxin-antitoxin system prevent-host-death family antitoxin [Miltoncostaeaceae bacterium]